MIWNWCNLLLLLVLVLWCPAPGAATPMEILPFRTGNLSPVMQIFGLPRDTDPAIIPAATLHTSLIQELSSNYTVASNSRERIMLDGETYRISLAARYGIGGDAEVGVEVPWLADGGGFLDGFIIGWHRTFFLPQGGRDGAPRNRLNYSYRRDGVQKLLVDHAVSGIGDISLTGGLRLYDDRDELHHSRLALKTAVKLPTGDSSALRGSGSTDLSLLLCGSINTGSEWGTLGVFGSVGGVAMTGGGVIADQQNHAVGFGSLGTGWGPASWLSFKIQLNGNTPVYSGSSLAELSAGSLLLIMGGTLKLAGGYLVDIGVSEDVAVATAPDVGFHLAVSRSF